VIPRGLSCGLAAGRLASCGPDRPRRHVPDTPRSARGWQQRYVDGTSDIHQPQCQL